MDSGSDQKPGSVQIEMLRKRSQIIKLCDRSICCLFVSSMILIVSNHERWGWHWRKSQPGPQHRDKQTKKEEICGPCWWLGYPWTLWVQPRHIRQDPDLDMADCQWHHRGRSQSNLQGHYHQLECSWFLPWQVWRCHLLCRLLCGRHSGKKDLCFWCYNSCIFRLCKPWKTSCNHTQTCKTWPHWHSLM